LTCKQRLAGRLTEAFPQFCGNLTWLDKDSCLAGIPSPDEERVEDPPEERTKAKDGEDTDVGQKTHDWIERIG